MSLSDTMKAVQKSMSEPKEPVWKGPEVDGVTQSLLGKFLVCRERFRIYAIEGLVPRQDFNHRLEYGNMWHVCEEAAEAERVHFDGELNGIDTTLWQDNLAGYVENLATIYPLRQQDIIKWAQVCAAQFPVYIKHWERHQDVVIATNLLKEKAFDVPYQLPSGRTVRLRGKWDSVDFLPAHRDGTKEYPDGIWLQENKTKGDIDPVAINQQLRRDLQTMIYLIALDAEAQDESLGCGVIKRTPDEPYDRRWSGPILGVRYNVVRRPLSGGRHSISQHKATLKKHTETEAEFYARLAGLIQGEPEYFFMRWKSSVSSTDIERFRHMTLDPLLEQMCEWYDWVSHCCGDREDAFGHQHGAHFVYPYGVYNPLMDGGSGDTDEFINSGSQIGLRHVDNLFPELS